MDSGSLATLFHPFETGVLDFPGETERVLVLGVTGDFRRPDDLAADLTLVQGFRPDFRALKQRSYAVFPEMHGHGYTGSFVLAGRHRGQNEARIADALDSTEPGGLVLVAGGNDDGIASLRKRLSKILTLDGHLPKYHGSAFWFRRPADAAEAIAALRSGNGVTAVGSGFETAPGMFSHGAIDAGSSLLAQHVPRDLKGAAADFCAGWGFLSVALKESNPGIASIDIYEADHAALAAAKRNLAKMAPSLPARFLWHDLVGEVVDQKYDVVVMNPPFHKAGRAEPDLGQALIRTAAKALKRGGRLVMVANRQLPYEQTLAGSFGRYTQLFGDGSYKVFCAWR